MTTSAATDCTTGTVLTPISLPGYTLIDSGTTHTHLYPAGSVPPPSCGPNEKKETIPNGGHWLDWHSMAVSKGRDYIIDDDEIHIYDDDPNNPGRIIVRPIIPWPNQCRVLLPAP